MERKHNIIKDRSNISNAAVSTESLKELSLTWERLIPEQIADDLASQRIFELHCRGMVVSQG